MQTFTLIATTTSDLGHSHSVMDALPHLAGMLMVLITLTILWGLTALVSKLVSVLHLVNPPPAPVAAKGKSAAAQRRQPQVVDGISPEIVVAISAAIACMKDGNRRVISIKPVSTHWEKAGRQSVLVSHRIR